MGYFDRKYGRVFCCIPTKLGVVILALCLLVGALLDALPSAFRNKDHQEDVQEIVSRSLASEHEYFAALSRKAQEVGFAVKSTKTGLITVPMADDKALSNKEYEALSEEDKKKVEERRRLLEPFIHDFVSRTRPSSRRPRRPSRRRTWPWPSGWHRCLCGG